MALFRRGGKDPATDDAVGTDESAEVEDDDRRRRGRSPRCRPSGPAARGTPREVDDDLPPGRPRRDPRCPACRAWSCGWRSTRPREVVSAASVLARRLVAAGAGVRRAAHGGHLGRDPRRDRRVRHPAGRLRRRPARSVRARAARPAARPDARGPHRAPARPVRRRRRPALVRARRASPAARRSTRPRRPRSSSSSPASSWSAARTPAPPRDLLTAAAARTGHAEPAGRRARRRRPPAVARLRPADARSGDHGDPMSLKERLQKARRVPGRDRGRRGARRRRTGRSGARRSTSCGTGRAPACPASPVGHAAAARGRARARGRAVRRQRVARPGLAGSPRDRAASSPVGALKVEGLVCTDRRPAHGVQPALRAAAASR